MTERFEALVGQITYIGRDYHAQAIIENSKRNAPLVERTIRDVAPKNRSCLVVSAGPSLYRQRILQRFGSARGNAVIVASDGAYIQCLKAGIRPDWVVTIDPHPTRIVRWFGDPDWEENSRHDDYFKRQDLAEDFRADSARKNAENIRAVDDAPAKLVICSAAPANVVARTSRFERFWFAPLVDNPDEEGITRTICAETGLPALNTGGTVGTAAWAFAHCVLGARDVAVVGMDFGYPMDTPLKNTQEWNLTGGDPALYPQFPERGYYTSPTYWWYRGNFLDLLEAADARVTNCSGAGLLYGERVDEMLIEAWLKSCS